MKFVKSNHRATLKNEHLRELIHTALTTYCPGFRGLENQTKISYWQLLYIIWCKTCIFTVFVLTTNWLCGSLVFLVFCKWLFYWTSLPTPGLYYM